MPGPVFQAERVEWPNAKSEILAVSGFVVVPLLWLNTIVAPGRGHWRTHCWWWQPRGGVGNGGSDGRLSDRTRPQEGVSNQGRVRRPLLPSGP